MATDEHHPRRDEAFRLLSKRWKKWSNNTEIRSALAQSTLRKWKRLQGNTEEEIAHKDHAYALAFSIRELGQCRDPKLIPTLLPYLKWDARHIAEDKIRLGGTIDHNFGRDADDFILPPTFRIRDEALYAILTIQYGDPKLGLVDLGYQEFAPQRIGATWHLKEEDRWRNVLIQKVIDAAK
ncbi:MAG: hypothetical protein JJU29_02535 [Verrucomicrobia bacterium]|nr:hypothetical protein [Verrucomicrobiota bacterium]